MKTRFPTTSGKSSETVGNRPPSRTLPRRLPPTPKGVGGEVVGNLRILEHKTTPEIVSILHTLRTVPEIVSCAAWQAGRECHVPTRHPSRQARRKAEAWGPRLPRGASGRIGEGGDQGGEAGRATGAARRKAGTWGPRLPRGASGRIGEGGDQGGKAGRATGQQRGRKRGGCSIISPPAPPLVGSFQQGPAIQVRARASLLSRASETVKTRQPRAKNRPKLGNFDQSKSRPLRSPGGPPRASGAKCRPDKEPKTARARTQTGPGKPVPILGGFLAFSQRIYFSIRVAVAERRE